MSESGADAKQDLAPLLERCFLFDAVETSYALEGISGYLPDWLRGSYYVNGPARFERGGFRYKHWLDGDGMVCALRFDQAKVEFTSRFVGTHKLEQEQKAGRPLFRSFGTSFRGDQLRRGLMLEPPANVSVYAFAGRELAFGEQTLPYSLDPISLETQDQWDFHGRLNEVSPFAAHPKFDAETGHMVNFGTSFSSHNPALHIYEFDLEGRLLKRKRHRLALPYTNHDFGLTRDHYVFCLSPLLMDFQRFWQDGKSVLESLVWESERETRLLVIPRSATSTRSVNADSFEISLGQGYCLHWINCFAEAGWIYADVLEMEAPVYGEYQPIPDLYQDLKPGRPVRYVVDPDSKTLIDRIPLDYDRGPDFPSLDARLSGKSYSDFWMLGISSTGIKGRKFFDQLAHGNWSERAVKDVYQVPLGEYLGGEPIYVADPNDPNQSVIIIQHFDPVQDLASFLLFDARNVSQGPLTRLLLRHKIHPGFHATFVAQEPPNSARREA